MLKKREREFPQLLSVAPTSPVRGPLIHPMVLPVAQCHGVLLLVLQAQHAGFSGSGLGVTWVFSGSRSQTLLSLLQGHCPGQGGHLFDNRTFLSCTSAMPPLCKVGLLEIHQLLDERKTPPGEGFSQKTQGLVPQIP